MSAKQIQEAVRARLVEMGEDPKKTNRDSVFAASMHVTRRILEEHWDERKN